MLTSRKAMNFDLSEYLENVIDDIGGLGLFQWILIIIVLGSKVSVVWSILMMQFGGATPDWYCDWKTKAGDNYTLNQQYNKKCSWDNTSISLVCAEKHFDPGMSTVVSEWELVCDRDWITATITTIQMGGLLFGGFISGQIADTFGRKLTYYISLFVLLVFNAAAAFSTSWQMFATIRFFIGIGCGFYTTIFFTYLIEFTPRKYRSMIISIPSWSFWAIIFGLMSWGLHNWMYIQIATAVVTLPWFIGIKFVPESYRWLVSNGKIKEAHAVLAKIAKWNGKSEPDMTEFTSVVELHRKKIHEKKYTLIDVLRRPSLLKTTILLAIPRISCGYGYYAISFGVQQLSGNLYINLILISAVDIVSVVVWYFANCIGRKWTTFAFFLLAGLTGMVVGVVQFTNIGDSDKGNLINGFALTAKLCVSCGWASLMLLTSESYPTVVRNIGFGVHNAMSRAGAMVAPQLVFASKRIPGISYLLFGGLMIVSAFCALGVHETNNSSLQDTMDEDTNQDSLRKDSGEPNTAFKTEETDILLTGTVKSYSV